MSGEPYRWSKGLKLTPDQYFKLGQVMAALGPRVTELANEQPPVEHQQLTEAELAELIGAIGEADQEGAMDESAIDMDQVIRSSLPLSSYRRSLGLSNPELERFSRTFEMSHATEQERIRQDERTARSASTAEERLQASLRRLDTGTLVPAGQFAAPHAREFSVQAGAINGGINCGPTDEMTGLCRERYHSASCGSIADPFTAESLRPAMARLATQPVLDADGRVHLDAATGSPMTMTDMAEWNTGIRLADKSLFESGRARRALASPQRPIRFGDPDSPADEEAWAPVSVSTRRTAQRLADANGELLTSADKARQQAAHRAEYDRQMARLRPARHPDYAVGLSNPVHRDTRLVPSRTPCSAACRSTPPPGR